MSFDEIILQKVIDAAKKTGLEFIVIGNAGAALQGVPVTTHDLDFFVRKTPKNLKKIQAFALILDGVVSQPYEPLSEMMRVTNPNIVVDFIFRLSNQKKFESVRSRAKKREIGKNRIMVASLVDIIAAKEAAGRPKDRATLPLLKNAAQTQEILERGVEGMDSTAG